MNFILSIAVSLAFVTPIYSIEKQDIVYKKVDGRKLHLHLVKPDQWKPTDTRPAIVWFHGGGWVGGPVKQFEDHSEHFAKLGVV